MGYSPGGTRLKREARLGIRPVDRLASVRPLHFRTLPIKGRDTHFTHRVTSALHQTYLQDQVADGDAGSAGKNVYCRPAPERRDEADAQSAMKLLKSIGLVTLLGVVFLALVGWGVIFLPLDAKGEPFTIESHGSGVIIARTGFKSYEAVCEERRVFPPRRQATPASVFRTCDTAAGLVGQSFSSLGEIDGKGGRAYVATSSDDAHLYVDYWSADGTLTMETFRVTSLKLGLGGFRFFNLSRQSIGWVDPTPVSGRMDYLPRTTV